MTKNERFLLFILVTLSVFIAITIAGLSISDRIKTAQESIMRYGKAVRPANSLEDEIQFLESQLLEMRSLAGGNPANYSQTLTEMTASIRTKLGKTGITPIKVVVSGSEGNETVEFILKCTPSSFMNFLSLANQPGGDYTYSSINIRQAREEDTLDITMRISHEK